MVLLLKGMEDYWGIGVLEMAWNICANVVNCRLKGIMELHDFLHGFRKDQGTGTAKLEENLEQHLVGLAHEPLFQVFLGVRKSYNSLGCGWCMELLRGCGMGTNLARLLARYWGRQKIVPKTGRLLSKAFGTGHGVTQGNPASPMIFNIMVDTVVRAVLVEVCIPQESHFGLGWAAGERNFVLYADDRQIEGREHIWVQDALKVTLAMFQWMGLEINLDKTKSMVCTPGYIWGRLSDTAYKRRETGFTECG